MLTIPKRDRKYIALLVLAVAGVLAAEWFAPEPLDWTPSFEAGDARPLGSAVPRDVLPALFPAAAVKTEDRPPYLVLRDTARGPASYLFVTAEFAPDAAEAAALLRYAERGGTVFAAARTFKGALADSLRLETERGGLFGSASADSARLQFSSPSLAEPGGYRYARGIGGGAFARFDTARTVVLSTDDDGRPTYLRTRRGAGAFYLSSTPAVFTNYAMLADSNAAYIYKALSYLPDQGGTVLWDARYKPARQQATSPLRFVLAQPALKAAYWLLLGAALLFVVFEGKRRQRAIPVVEPPRNDTADFVETVGRLYFQRGDHADLARKKITYFFDYLRNNLNLAARTIDADLIQKTAERSGVPEADVQRLFATVREAQKRERLSEEELKALTSRIESFYEKSQR